MPEAAPDARSPTTPTRVAPTRDPIGIDARSHNSHLIGKTGPRISAREFVPVRRGPLASRLFRRRSIRIRGKCLLPSRTKPRERNGCSIPSNDKDAAYILGNPVVIERQLHIEQVAEMFPIHRGAKLQAEPHGLHSGGAGQQTLNEVTAKRDCRLGPSPALRQAFRKDQLRSASRTGHIRARTPAQTATVNSTARLDHLLRAVLEQAFPSTARRECIKKPLGCDRLGSPTTASPTSPETPSPPDVSRRATRRLDGRRRRSRLRGPAGRARVQIEKRYRPHASTC